MRAARRDVADHRHRRGEDLLDDDAHRIGEPARRVHAQDDDVGPLARPPCRSRARHSRRWPARSAPRCRAPRPWRPRLGPTPRRSTEPTRAEQQRPPARPAAARSVRSDRPSDACARLGQGPGRRRTDAPGRLNVSRPWQCLYFLPEPQGQGALRGTLPQLEGGRRGCSPPRPAATARRPCWRGPRGAAPAGRGRCRWPGAPAASAASATATCCGCARISRCESTWVTVWRRLVSMRLEQGERLALVLVQRIALAVAAQMDALAQMVEMQQVLLPQMVEDLQQQALLGHAVMTSGP